MKVLCVDDSRMMRRIVGDVVTGLGHEPLDAANCREAIERIAADGQQVGLILLDWNMPEMTGLALLHSLKADPAYRHIPVIMVTSEGNEDRIAEAMQAGAVDYVTKPFTRERLAQVILLCVPMP